MTTEEIDLVEEIFGETGEEIDLVDEIFGLRPGEPLREPTASEQAQPQPVPEPVGGPVAAPAQSEPAQPTPTRPEPAQPESIPPRPIPPEPLPSRPIPPEPINWESASMADSVEPGSVAPAAPPLFAAPTFQAPPAVHAAAAVSAAPTLQPELIDPTARPKGRTRRRAWAARFAVAFVLGAVVTMVLITVAALVALSAFSNRVAYGVRVGTVDVSGLNRDQVIARLQTSFAYLSQGEATVTTPSGTATITYQQAGRAPDLESMADAALGIGHTGYPVDDSVSMLRSAIDGKSIPVVVNVDPTAIATRVRQLVGANQTAPQDARATVQDGGFVLTPATPGYGIDERALAGAIIDRLTQPDARADLRVDATYKTLPPQIGSQEARDAIAEAQRIAVDVNLTWSGAPASPSPSTGASPSPSTGAGASPSPSAGASPSPSTGASPTAGGSPRPSAGGRPAASSSASPSPSPRPPAGPSMTYTISAQAIRGWIVFGLGNDGRYAPSIRPNLVQAYVSGLASSVGTSAVEPSVVYDNTTGQLRLSGGEDGAAVDVAATSQALEAYLDLRAAGKSPGPALAIVATPVPPDLTFPSLNGMVKIGAWTTTFYPDISNGYGANIRIPAKLLNGQVVAPGQKFSFLKAVAPIDTAHGYALGGVIENGKSNHTGAIGGGICSASTTMFNAAARAGLQIDERHAHSYYITRYPVGLDATVFSNGRETMDLKWTNDTPYPILIRGSSTKGSRSTVTIELWSLPLGRVVTFSPEYKANVLKATDHTQYVSGLRPGQKVRAEYPTDGFDTSRTRTVTDATGKVIHLDTWKSHYERVNGLLQIGRAAAPSQTPSPSPSRPTPGPAAPAAATLPRAPTMTPEPRCRKVR